MCVCVCVCVCGGEGESRDNNNNNGRETTMEAVKWGSEVLKYCYSVARCHHSRSSRPVTVRVHSMVYSLFEFDQLFAY